MKAISIFLSFVLTFLMFWSAQANHHEEVMVTSEPMVTSETIVDIAAWNEDFSTLVAAVVAADLADTLSSEGPFTVFAPLNSAFAKLPAGTVETLLLEENKELLQSILTYHVLAGDIRASALQKGLSVETVEGSEVRFEMTGGKWYINGAQILSTDIVAANGVIHVIDSVILPSASMEDMQTEKERLEAVFSEREMKIITNFDVSLKKMMMGKTEDTQKMYTNRILSTIDIALRSEALTVSQQNLLAYIKLHIEMM